MSLEADSNAGGSNALSLGRAYIIASSVAKANFPQLFLTAKEAGYTERVRRPAYFKKTGFFHARQHLLR